jgi:hypothetical protein
MAAPCRAGLLAAFHLACDVPATAPGPLPFAMAVSATTTHNCNGRLRCTLITCCSAVPQQTLGNYVFISDAMPR